MRPLTPDEEQVIPTARRNRRSAGATGTIRPTEPMPAGVAAQRSTARATSSTPDAAGRPLTTPCPAPCSAAPIRTATGRKSSAPPAGPIWGMSSKANASPQKTRGIASIPCRLNSYQKKHPNARKRPSSRAAVSGEWRTLSSPSPVSVTRSRATRAVRCRTPPTNRSARAGPATPKRSA